MGEIIPLLFVCFAVFLLLAFNPGPLYKLYYSALKLEHLIRNQRILVSKVLSVYWKHPLAVPLAVDEHASHINSEYHTPELPSQQTVPGRLAWTPGDL